MGDLVNGMFDDGSTCILSSDRWNEGKDALRSEARDDCRGTGMFGLTGSWSREFLILGTFMFPFALWAAKPAFDCHLHSEPTRAVDCVV